MKNEKKQTAVGYLEKTVNAMIKNGGDSDLLAVLWHIQQAKEMEKNQIKSIFCDGLICGIENPKVTPKQYYNQIWEGGEK